MGSKRILAAAAAAGFLFASSAVHAEGIRVAVVDAARVLNDCQAGKAAKKSLEGRQEELQKELDARKEATRKAKEELDGLKVLYDKSKGKEKLKEKEAAFQSRLEEYQKFGQEAEKEMRGKLQEMTRSINRIIEEKVNRLVAEEKIDLLLDAQQGGPVLHFAPSLDLTAKVLALVDAETGAPAEGAGGKEKP